jgi:hypothetical protein
MRMKVVAILWMSALAWRVAWAQNAPLFRTGRNISIGGVYATLERLEAKGYVSSSTAPRRPSAGAAPNGCFASRPPASGRCKYRSKHFAA